MEKLFNPIRDYFAWVVESIWDWLFLLNEEEWMLLLALVAACGFLCMRGFGSRHNY